MVGPSAGAARTRQPAPSNLVHPTLPSYGAGLPDPMKKPVALAFLILATAASSAPKPPEAAAPTIVYAVRHAEKGGAKGEKDPPLSAAGAARARALVHVLADVKFDAIYVSTYRRTQETAAPVAQAQALTPIVLAPDSVAAHILSRNQGKTVLVVGHSNTVPAVLAGLGVGDPVAIAETQFDNLFIVSRAAGPAQLLHLHYGTPDSPGRVEPGPTPAAADTTRAPRG